MPRLIRLAAVLVVTASVTVGCGDATPPEESAPTPHGHVEGAEEAAEAQWRLTVADHRGRLGLLDPVSTETRELGTADEATAMATDGRHVFVTDGERVSVFDTGVWTVDHGDHSHYYRAEPREVGAVDVAGRLTVTKDAKTTLLSGSHGAVALERAGLDDGEVTVSATVDTAAAVLYRGRILATADDAIRVFGRDGDRQGSPVAKCPDARGATTTARGAVFACRDGAVLVTGDAESGFEANTVPYPDGTGEVTGRLTHRFDTPVVAQTTKDGAVIVLDVAAAAWARLPVDDAVAATGTGEDSPVLVLDREGTLHAFDPDGGSATASAELFGKLETERPPSIQADPERAYLNDAGNGALIEIDYHDDLRVAREIATDSRPELLVETGW